MVWQSRCHGRREGDDGLLRLELGNFSNVKGVGAGVFEYRIDFGPGYRVYFGQVGTQLVLLLCGGDKGSQKRDIKTAKEYWADYRRRYGK